MNYFNKAFYSGGYWHNMGAACPIDKEKSDNFYISGCNHCVGYLKVVLYVSTNCKTSRNFRHRLCSDSKWIECFVRKVVCGYRFGKIKFCLGWSLNSVSAYKEIKQVVDNTRVKFKKIVAVLFSFKLINICLCKQLLNCSCKKYEKSVCFSDRKEEAARHVF